MSSTGRNLNANGNGQAHLWTGRLFTAADIRQLNGCGALVLTKKTILTPLAADELRERGVEVRRDGAAPPAAGAKTWGLAQERQYPVIASVLAALAREGLALSTMPTCEAGNDCDWARQLAEFITHGECQGGVVFCSDPGLVCCVANKHAGLRAVAVTSAQGAAKAALSVAPNLIAVEMPGRTFFETRQLLRAVCVGNCACPPTVARTLSELEGHPKSKGGCKCASAK